MQRYIAKAGDTLRKIANRFHFALDEIHALNPQITGQDMAIAPGIVVFLPSPGIRVPNHDIISCPPEPPMEVQDQWIPLNTAEQMAQNEYDVLIIGSGAGGGAVLWRLCEKWGRNGKRIGMVEAGGLHLPTHARNLPTFDEKRVVDYWLRVADLAGNLWPDYRGAKIVRGIGGRTIIWAMVTPRILPFQFATWPISYKEIVPYYAAAEKIMNITDSYSKGSAIQDVLLGRLHSGGFSEATNLPLAADMEATRYGQVHSNVFFSSIEFLARALNIRAFDLAVETRAVQVMTEKGKAAGVRVMTSDKKTYMLKAKTIVVSGSTWETPRLLLHSNIPGEAIGRYLVNHPEIAASATARRAEFPEKMGIANILFPSSAHRDYHLFAFTEFTDYYWYHYREQPLKETVQLGFRGYSVVEARHENYVTLDPVKRDEFGIPQLNVHFSYSNRDQALINVTMATLRRFISAMKLTLVTPPWLAPPGADNHETGTCRMGDDPATSATNRYGQIHGISGLYVADNSVIRLTSPVNPTLTTVALATRTADYIAEQLN